MITVVACAAAAALVVAFVVHRLIEERREQSPAAREVQNRLMMAGRIGVCDACGRSSLTGHELRTLAVAVPHDAGSADLWVARLTAALDAKSWAEASKMNEFDGRNDGVIAYLLRCPIRSAVVLLLSTSYYELMSEDSWLRREILSEDESASAWTAATAEGSMILP